MQLRTVWLFGTLTTLGLAMPLPGQTEGLVECNNCASPEQVALASGPGLTVVVDFEQATVHGFEVTQATGEAGGQAIPVQIPPSIEAAFLRNVAAVMDAEQAERDAERLRQPPPEKKE